MTIAPTAKRFGDLPTGTVETTFRSATSMMLTSFELVLLTTARPLSWTGSILRTG